MGEEHHPEWEACKRPEIDYRAALEDALEGMREMIPYVPHYFVQKWNLRAYIERAERALAAGGHHVTVVPGPPGFDSDVYPDA